MSAERYVTWHAYSVAGYAEENVKSGRWTEDEALSKSEADFKALLPDGLDSAGNSAVVCRGRGRRRGRDPVGCH